MTRRPHRRRLSLLLLSALPLLGQAPCQPDDRDLIFSAMGDVPYLVDDYAILADQIADHNANSPSSFVVHLGDIKSGSTPCWEIFYSSVADILRASSAPTFMVPGDNEWNDCWDPDQAWMRWEKYFAEFDTHWATAPVVWRQEQRHENFAWVEEGVLLVGINLVGGRVHDAAEWQLRLQQNADWVSSLLDTLRPTTRAAVIFAHARPVADHEFFVTHFRAAAATYGKPVLFLHGDGHTWVEDHPWPEQNITRVQVGKGGEAPPVQVTVPVEGDLAFVFDRTP